METMVIFALLVLLTAPSSSVNGNYYSKSRRVDVPTTIKQTNLHFFMHDTVSGNNPSVVLVAKPNGTIIRHGTLLPFGALYVFDDPLTVGPDPNSEIIGNARGLYISTSRESSDFTLLYNGDFEFTSGEFNGSSISVFSREVDNEVTVVGGRGKLRMAQGFILLNGVFLNATTGDAILECNVTIFHQ